jgi:hypothetical protein
VICCFFHGQSTRWRMALSRLAEKVGSFPGEVFGRQIPVSQILIKLSSIEFALEVRTRIEGWEDGWRRYWT